MTLDHDMLEVRDFATGMTLTGPSGGYLVPPT